MENYTDLLNASHLNMTTVSCNQTIINATLLREVKPSIDNTFNIVKYSCSHGFHTAVEQEYQLSDAFIAYSKAIGCINCILPLPTIITNLLPIIAIIKTSNLHTKPNFILINMMCKNLIEAAILQPNYAAVILMRIKGIPTCFSFATCFLGYTCLVEAMCTQILLAYEQYTATVYPYKYKSRISSKCLAITVTATWILSTGCAACACFFEQRRGISAVAIGLVIITAYASTIYSHIKLSKLVKGMRITDRENRIGEEDEDARNEREQRESRASFLTCYIVVLPLVFYLPTVIRNLLIPIIGYEIWSSYAVNTILILNGIVSPILYSYQVPAISREVKKLLKRNVGAVAPQ